MQRVRLERGPANLITNGVAAVDLGFLLWGVARLSWPSAAGGAAVGEGIFVQGRKCGLFEHDNLLGGSVPWIRIRTKQPGHHGN
jgi:hypothetical protein